MNITISIDDLHPEKGWGCEGDEAVTYLEKLNEEFGCKFTLFIPSNYHGKYPLSEHKEWVDFWKSKDWVELAAHGHYHECTRDDIGECEFYELDKDFNAEKRIIECMVEWEKVGHKPMGWRNPGWLAHPEAIKVIGPYFKYAALHEEHNHGVQWECKEFFGCSGINETDIKLKNNTIMFQSHISGDWNDNVWNKTNYEQFRLSLKFLIENYRVNFITLGELAERKKVIYLINVGNLNYTEHTLPLIQDYANKVNADVRIFDDTHYDGKNYPSPNFLLFDIFNDFVSTDYEQMLYMDTDIRIMDNSPDIFNEVNTFGMVQDHKADLWRKDAMQKWLDKNYSDMEIKHYFNGGVIVSDKKSIVNLLQSLPTDIISFWKSTLDTFPHGYNQNILNYCIIKSGIEYVELSDKWNKVCRNADGSEYFIHYVANKNQIQTEQDKFKDNKVNSNIEMTL